MTKKEVVIKKEISILQKKTNFIYTIEKTIDYIKKGYHVIIRNKDSKDKCRIFCICRMEDLAAYWRYHSTNNNWADIEILELTCACNGMCGVNYIKRITSYD